MRTLLVPVIGVLATKLILEYLDFPYVALAVCWFGIFVFLSFRSGTLSKVLWYNLAWIMFLLGLAEQTVSLYREHFGTPVHRFQGTYADRTGNGYYKRSDVFGYGPDGEASITSRKLYGEHAEYDVEYSIGSDGLRVTPAAQAGETISGCILCFGGSYTFGEGVDDHDTMPYILGTLQSLKVHNYGFHGYGPHQMLSAIQNGRVRCSPRLVIYQAIADHVARAAGYASWDRHGPRYAMQNGRVVRSGHFDDPQEGGILDKVVKMTEPYLRRSHSYRFIFGERYRISNEDIELYLGIVEESYAALLSEYPEVEFHVILWDDDESSGFFQKLRDGLKEKFPAVHMVSDILPCFETHYSMYKVGLHDQHPSPLAHKLVAEYVIGEVLDMK